MDRTLKFALASLVFNMAFATYHLIMGLVTSSWWLLTLGSYYLVLSIVRRSTSAMLITLRNISFADAFVSIFALQRSMLVSFEGMRESEIVIMNATLGSAVCVIVFLLGLNLIRNKKILFKSIDQ